jgi:hypothetical protein
MKSSWFVVNGLLKKIFLSTACYLLLATVIMGCASFKEGCKGFLGVSTKVLEDARKDAIAKEFNYSHKQCYEIVRKALVKQAAYIYSEDKSKDMLALYVSEEDTTPVGIFFKEVSPGKTQLEVSSPSKYAKELIANAVFSALANPLTLEKKENVEKKEEKDEKNKAKMGY